MLVSSIAGDRLTLLCVITLLFFQNIALRHGTYGPDSLEASACDDSGTPGVIRVGIAALPYPERASTLLLVVPMDSLVRRFTWYFAFSVCFLDLYVSSKTGPSRAHYTRRRLPFQKDVSCAMLSAVLPRGALDICVFLRRSTVVKPHIGAVCTYADFSRVFVEDEKTQKSALCFYVRLEAVSAAAMFYSFLSAYAHIG